MGFKNLIHRWNKDSNVLLLYSTSTSAVWSPITVTNTGSTLFWAVSNDATGSFVGDDPTLDLTGNVGTAHIKARDSSGITWLDLASLNITYGWWDECIFLEHLEIQSNQISTCDLTPLVNLTYFDCYNNTIATLDFSNSPNMDYIRASYMNALTSIDLSGCTELTTIDVTECNTLQTLITTGNTKIVTFKANDCNLQGAYDFTHLPDVTSIACNYNQLTSLNFSGRTKLTNIVANQNNGCTSVDIRGCSALTSMNFGTTPGASGLFDSSDNALITNWNWTNSNATSYDFTNNTAVTTLNASIGDYSSIDISMMTNLRNLYVYSNGNLTSLNISANTLVSYVRLYSTNVSNSDQDQIYIDLESFSVSGGTLDIDSHALSASAATARNILSGGTRNWTINLY